MEGKDKNLPDGFRLVEENEILPNGEYETKLNLETGLNITNAPKKDITKEVTPQEKKTVVEIDAEKIKNEDKDENVKINVKTGGISGLKKFVGSTTKVHELDEDKEESKIDNDGKVLIGSHISDDEYKLISSVLITLFDTVIINIFKFWSGDTKDSSYGLGKAKRNELADLLGQILRKHNVKWSIELLFVFMLVLAYAPQAKNAYEYRQAVKQSKSNLRVSKKEDSEVLEKEETEEEKKIGRPTTTERIEKAKKKIMPKKRYNKHEVVESLYESSEEIDLEKKAA